MEAVSDSGAIRAARFEVLLRDYNERIKAHHGWVNPPFAEWVCECADEKCAEPVELSIKEYEAVRADPHTFSSRRAMSTSALISSTWFDARIAIGSSRRPASARR